MKHIKRLIAKMISFFISSPGTKKHVYEYLSEFSIFDIFNIHKFIKTPIRNNSVLLIETNGCHGEVISAYFKYFQDIGYNVDIVMHTFIYREKHFSRHDLTNVNIFHMLTTAMHKIFLTKKMNQYKAIIVLTPMNYTFKNQPVLTMFPELNRFNNLYFVAHNIPNIENYYNDFDHSRIFGLGRRLGNFPCTNPHLFGTVHKNQAKHNPTTFITVGGINPKRKNHDLLISAIKRLADLGYNFKVIIVGDGGKIPNLTDDIKKYIILAGRQIGEKMFRFMEESDFFLPLWDKNNNDHNRYRTNQVSGSPQLIYGFNKIPIVQREFTEFYDFDDTNSIIYDDDNLTQAMEYAIKMSNKQYKQIYDGLSKLSQDVYNESKQNIISKLK